VLQSTTYHFHSWLQRSTSCVPVLNEKRLHSAGALVLITLLCTTTFFVLWHCLIERTTRRKMKNELFTTCTSIMMKSFCSLQLHQGSRILLASVGCFFILLIVRWPQQTIHFVKELRNVGYLFRKKCLEAIRRSRYHLGKANNKCNYYLYINKEAKLGQEK